MASIEEMGGLQPYLDATRRIHNGYGYEDFVQMSKLADKANVARIFNVTRATVYDWLDRLEVETAK